MYRVIRAAVIAVAGGTLAVATAGAASASVPYNSWASAQRAAGFRLMWPAWRLGLDRDLLSVGSCGRDTAKRVVTADYGTSAVVAIGVIETNGGPSCGSGEYYLRAPHTRLASVSIDGTTAQLSGYCNQSGFPSCSSPAGSYWEWLTWSRHGVRFTVLSVDWGTRAQLLRFARHLRPVS